MLHSGKQISVSWESCQFSSCLSLEVETLTFHASHLDSSHLTYVWVYKYFLNKQVILSPNGFVMQWLL